MAVTRRRFLVGALAAAGGGALAITGARRSAARLVERWTRWLARVPIARDLGVEYATRYPEDADDAALTGDLADLAGLLAVFAGEAHNREQFRTRMRQEFDAGPLLSLGGWRLSRTELRLCALAARTWGREHGAVGVFAPGSLPGPDGGPPTAVHWTAPRARLRVVPAAGAWECRLRTGGATDARVSLHVDGRTIGELAMASGVWQRVRYPVRGSLATPFELEVTTQPAWQPAGDFRTLGVAFDRLWTDAG